MRVPVMGRLRYGEAGLKETGIKEAGIKEAG
jgi:hypothetical protein